MTIKQQKFNCSFSYLIMGISFRKKKVGRFNLFGIWRLNEWFLKDPFSVAQLPWIVMAIWDAHNISEGAGWTKQISHSFCFFAISSPLCLYQLFCSPFYICLILSRFYGSIYLSLPHFYLFFISFLFFHAFPWFYYFVYYSVYIHQIS